MTNCNTYQNRFFGNLDDFLSQTLRSLGAAPATADQPGTYRYESDDSYRLRIDLPGFIKDEVKLTLEKQDLRIEAKTEREEAYRTDAEFSFTMPDDIDSEGIEAKMENGVLDLIFRKLKPEERGARTIEIG